MKRTPIDPDLLRGRLSEAQGKHYWRCLEELADEPQFRTLLDREFAADSSVWADGLSRRKFLTLMGASLALAGLSGCRPPAGRIMPYVRQPDNLVLGKPLYYATAKTISGFATGLLVESHEGRPTKIEGNDKHPASRGATTVQHQAAVLGLYDPDRSQAVLYRAQPRSWGDAIEALRARLRPGTPRAKGKGLAVLAEAIGSPTLLAQRQQFLAAYPEAKWYTYEPGNRDNATRGSELAFGKPHHSYPQLATADVIVSLDADFLGSGPEQLALTREFTDRRRAAEVRLPDGKTEIRPGGQRGMNRLYVFETDMTVTGSNADNRLAVRPSQIEAIARALAARLGIEGALAPDLDETQAKWVAAIHADLTRRDGKPRGPGTTLVLAGHGQPPAVHAIVHAINAALGNLGRTVVFTEPLPMQENSNRSLQTLIDSVNRNEVDTLIVLGGNPVFTAPADLKLGNLLEQQLKQPEERWLAVHLGMLIDETSRLCHWHLPQTHFLEEWSDAIAYDGTASIVQPLIAPLYGSRSPHELLGVLTPLASEERYDDRSPMELVQAYWRENRPQATAKQSFDEFWQQALHDGVVAGTKRPTVTPTLAGGLLNRPELRPAQPSGEKGMELLFAFDPGIYDGRFANNGWLQEWARPVTRLSWDNALLLSEATAKKLGVGTRIGNWKGGEHGETIADVVLVENGRYKLELPVFIVPGHADDALTVYLGYGRTHAGKIGTKTGYAAGQLRLVGDAWFTGGVKVTRTSREVSLACQQAHHSMEGRDLVRSATLEEYRHDPHFATSHEHIPGAPKAKDGKHGKHPLPSLIPNEHEYPGYKWGMAIDLNACTGCGACVVACQAENNIPVVGKEQVLRGREMHWIRIDRYFATPGKGHGHAKAENSEPAHAAAPLEVHFQPLPCQHCENAPCEVVCPVEATVHGDEGTNDMVYNRCVGTRYCANNCPYKVRRFNFLEYNDTSMTPSLRLGYNPDVTVRSRGVMEKCTFCIQRIAYARIEAAKEALDEMALPPKQRKRQDPNQRKEQGKDIAYIRDGEVVTACAAACPGTAIVFGDLNDPASKAAKLSEASLSYYLLGTALGTRPRVAYLASVTNPNPELQAK